jgi:putative ABC transport system permease protein
MFDLDKWQEIFSTIRKNKLRTFLTAFSVSWGIFMLMLLIGAGSGLLNGTKDRFKDDATNSMWIWPGQSMLPYKGQSPGRYIQFTNNDFDQVLQKIDGVEHISARFFISGNFTTRYGKNYSSFTIRSCHPAHQYLEGTIITKGRYLNEFDIQNKRKVAVIGEEVVETLFKEEEPIGKWIDIGGIQYKIVGVFLDEGSAGENSIIYLPISTAQMTYSGGNRINQLMFTIGDATPEESIAIQAATKELLFSMHNLDPNDPRGIRVRNNLESFQNVMDVFKAINLVIWFVGIMTIVAGIIGVSNIMLIVVKERKKEIGVRKALGATPGSIVSLIVQESVLITVFSGFMGMVAGIALVEGIGYAMKNFGIEATGFGAPEINGGAALTALIILIVAGVLAGFIPARKAVLIPPIEALREE